MSWRRGFFRLWIAISLLWTLGAGAVAIGAYSNPSQYIGQQVYYLRPGTFEPEEFAASSREHRDMEALRLAGEVVLVRMDGYYEVQFYAASTLPQASIAAGVDAVAAKVNAKREAASEDSRRSVIGWAPQVILIPPLVLLVLGAGIGWVLVGFRSR